MITPAEEDAVGEIGAPAVAKPVIDVVGFRPGGRSIAVGIHAAAVAHCERDLLSLRVEPLLASEIETAPLVVELQREVPVAESALDHRQRHGVVVSFDCAESRRRANGVFVDDQANAGSYVIENAVGVDGRAGPHEVYEPFGGFALTCGRIGSESLVARGGLTERARSARVADSTRMRELVEDALHEHAVLGLEFEFAPHHAVVFHPESPELALPLQVVALGDALEVESVASRS